MRYLFLFLAITLSACTVGSDAPYNPPRLGAACECDSYPCAGSCGGDGAFCRSGVCIVECVRSEDCPAGADCFGGACLYECEAPQDCPQADVPLCDGTCYGGSL